MLEKLTEEGCQKNGLSFRQGAALLAIGASHEEDYKALISKGYITACNYSMKDLNKKYTLSREGIEVFHALLADSHTAIASQTDDIEVLADKLREIYPKGKMEGTTYYYRCNKADIVRKLKSFFKRYGNYSHDQVFKATKAYVESFDGNLKGMRLLKYFIWKDEVKDGETIATSQLADWIENEGQTNTFNSNWALDVL